MPLAITPEDFSSSTSDSLRHQWTVGKMRHVIAALNNAEVTFITDRDTGSASIGRLVHTFEGGTDRGPRVTVETTLSDGTRQRTNYYLPTCGIVIEMAKIAEAKWTALQTYREESRHAITVAREMHPDWNYGAWTGTPSGEDSVSVTYRRQRENAGPRFGHETIRLSALTPRVI